MEWIKNLMHDYQYRANNLLFSASSHSSEMDQTIVHHSGQVRIGRLSCLSKNEQVLFYMQVSLQRFLSLKAYGDNVENDSHLGILGVRDTGFESASLKKNNKELIFKLHLNCLLIPIKQKIQDYRLFRNYLCSSKSRKNCSKNILFCVL